MPCRYIIDQENRLVISTAWDRLTFAEAKAHQDQLAIDPGFNPAFNQLIDATAVSTLEMTNDEAKSLVRRVIFSQESRRAFVAITPTIFGVGRLMGAHDEIARAPDRANVFSTRDAALEWLGAESNRSGRVESRRSTRVCLKVKIKAQGVTQPLICDGETLSVNLHGALISTTVTLRVGTEIEIHVIVTNLGALAKVVYVDPDRPKLAGIGLDRPRNIWGLSSPPEDWSASAVP